MKISDTIIKIDEVYRMGPSALGQGIISSNDSCKWIGGKYFRDWRESFTDETDDMMINNGKRFVIGKIYTFVSVKNNTPSRSTIFSVSNILKPADRFYEIGVEISSLTPLERANLFKSVFTTFGNIVEKNVTMQKNKQPAQEDIPIFEKNYRDAFFSLVGINPKLKQFRKLLILKNTIRCIQYEDWKYLIHCNL